MVTRIVGWLAAVILLAPLLSLVPAAVLVQGPEGQVRGAPFLLVLAVSDPLLGVSLLHSLEMAAAVGLGSGAVGLLLGGMIAGRCFWGRPVIRVALAGLAVLPPAFLALGLLGFAGGSGLRLWDGPSRLAAPEWGTTGWRWAAWLWAALVPGSALVAEAAIRELEAVNPRWSDAARLAGAGRLRMGLGIVWPSIRPGVSRAAWGQFVLTLADPGPPLILGLRRTIGHQIVVSALEPAELPRAAGAGVIALAVTIAIRFFLVRLLTGTGSGLKTACGNAARFTIHRENSATGQLLRAFLLPCFLLVGWLPVAGLAGLAIGAGSPWPVWVEGPRAAGTARLAGLIDSPVALAVARSSLLAIVVGLAVAAAVRVLPWQRPAVWSRLARTIGEVVPPLVLGVGLLALVHAGQLTASLLGSSVAGFTACQLSGSSGALDPSRVGGVLVALGALLTVLATRLGEPEHHRTDPKMWRGRIDQARLLGVSRARAMSLARAGGRAVPGSAILLWSVLAATDVSPALLLAGPDADWGVGPAVVSLSGGDGEARAQAAALALGAIAVCLFAQGITRYGARRMST